MKHKLTSVRSTAILLALCSLCGAFASCGDNKEPSGTDTKANTDTSSSDDTAELDSLEARKLVSDDVPELNFGGKDFRIFYQKRYTTDAVPEINEETGDIINDAIFRRNRTIEERFNVNIVGTYGEEDAMVTQLINSVSAGDDEYDLFLGHSIFSGRAALAGCFYNWYDIPYMDFSKPWFPQASIEGLTINDRMYLTVSDLCLSFSSVSYCMYFNKQMIEDYNLPDIYELVDNGEWTVDKLYDITKDMYRDLNGNSTADIDDQYGFASALSNHTTTWLFSCKVPTVELHEDGTVKSVFNSERASTLIDKLRKLYNDNPGSYLTAANSAQASPMSSFMNGYSAILTDSIGASVSQFRDVMFDYGIVPYPKYDEAQDGYYTIPGGSVSCMAVPKSTVDTELVGAVTAALARESWVSVMPDYYDIALKVKGVRDETSIRMLDIILDGRSVTAPFLYDSFVGYNYKVADLLGGNSELASYVASMDNKVIDHYESILELFCGEE